MDNIVETNSDVHDHSTDQKELKRITRKRRYALISAAFVPLSFILSAAIGLDDVVVIIVVIAVWAISLVLNISFHYSKCPRCHKLFFGRRYNIGFKIYRRNISCANCVFGEMNS